MTAIAKFVHKKKNNKKTDKVCPTYDANTFSIKLPVRLIQTLHFPNSKISTLLAFLI